MANHFEKKAFYTGGAESLSRDLKADGSVALTANWDVGAYTVTALRFISDQATGTAPFTVASTTVVTNLNASLLEGNAASAFATAAHTHAAYLNKDGSVALTSNWVGNAYQISRLVPVLALTDGATQAITAAQCQNYVIHNGNCTQAIEMDLPAAAVGMQITVVVTAAYTIKLDPNGSDQIMVYTGTAGDYLISDAVVGTAISLVCLIANKWHVAGATGSWTEE